jgi:hypothetical protein
VRIARFTSGGDPRFGLVDEEPGGSTLVVLTGDPLYMPVQPTGERVAATM